jgi:outer membrane protein
MAKERGTRLKSLPRARLTRFRGTPKYLSAMPSGGAGTFRLGCRRSISAMQCQDEARETSYSADAPRIWILSALLVLPILPKRWCISAKNADLHLAQSSRRRPSLRSRQLLPTSPTNHSRADRSSSDSAKGQMKTLAASATIGGAAVRQNFELRERLRAWLPTLLILVAGCQLPGSTSDGRADPRIKLSADASTAAMKRLPTVENAPRAQTVATPIANHPSVQLVSGVAERSERAAATSQESSASNARALETEQEEVPAELIEPASVADQLDLPSAVALSYRMQPRLRVYMESIAQARANSEIAFSPYLPTISGGASGGGFNLNVSGSLPTGFAFLPPGASFPIGLQLNSGYALEDIRMQWLICDFGRRAGRYNQAELGVAIAQLQTNRAYQTVANEVCLAYFQVLRAESLQLVAKEAVRRSFDDLDVAKKLHQQGATEREKVLRAEVQLAQSHRLLDGAESAAAISVAALNLAIGLNVSSQTRILGIADVPPLPGSLGDCLQTAISRRRELQVAQESVQVAQEGGRVARADFAPKILGDATYLNYQQGSNQADVGLALGFIRLEWGLFEGRRRIGEVRVADSKTRAAMALANSIADTISFQINEAYRQLIAAHRGIERAKPAVEQARENYRLVKARSAQGDATSAEITDAETSLTKAEQDHMNSVFDYLSVLAKLEYAMGVPSQESGAINTSTSRRLFQNPNASDDNGPSARKIQQTAGTAPGAG